MPRVLLLVEDNDIDARVVERRLVRLAVDVSLWRARNGEEALERLHVEHARRDTVVGITVITDLRMPRMGGFELLEQLAAQTRFATLPRYVLSTSSQPEDRARAGQFEITGYLVKPITTTALEAVVASSGTA